jgi:hypothetical protein
LLHCGGGAQCSADEYKPVAARLPRGVLQSPRALC